MRRTWALHFGCIALGESLAASGLLVAQHMLLNLSKP